MIGADRGLVLRTFALGETSRIVSVLGFAHGRLRLVAHGARAARNRFASSLEAGNELDLVYSLGPGRELGTLREAMLRRAHLAGTRRLAPLAVGLASLELLDRLVPEGAREPGLAEGTTGMLAALRGCDDRGSSLLLFYAFELRLLEWFGTRPEIGSCATCGHAAGDSDLVLDVPGGAAYCKNCRRGGGGGRLVLPAAAARILADLVRLPWDRIALRESAAADRRYVGVALHRLLAQHVDRYRRPRALLLLKKVDGDTAGHRSGGPSAESPTVA